MQKCAQCGREFEAYPVIDGVKLNLHGRKHCLDCRPLRRLLHARRRVAPRSRLLTCEACGDQFPSRIEIDGTWHSLYGRRFCLRCSPFGTHNTSKIAPGSMSALELAEYRRRRRNAKTYRSLKKRRRQRKRSLVAAAGGRCVDCGYDACLGGLEFHHRDPTTKAFGIGNFSGALERLEREASKCDLLCANCHRLRHAAEELPIVDPVVAHRRRRKLRAVAYMGGACYGCGRCGPASLFEFHHWDAKEKDFGIGQGGIPRSWAKVVAELAKCVMLCANCHREVHAGVRVLDEGLLGLAEPRLAYAA